jgi:hypothetical protein
MLTRDTHQREISSMNAFLFSIIFSSIGLAYIAYGKKNNRVDFMLTGIVLFAYTFFIGNLWAIIIIGLVLCVIPYIFN